MPTSALAFSAEPYSYAEARLLSEELGVSEPVAVTLVRRGYRTPDQARSFLAAEEEHPPAAFEGMDAVVGRVTGAIEAGRRITVHGDFDVDGVCATALTVGFLRELGADCDWLIPDRVGDGYGLSAENVRRLADRGTSLLLTVDCGISSAAEVALARELGMEVIVTDHHQAGSELPDCPILHPEVSGYPFTSLCGTAVAWKLACAVRKEVDTTGITRKVGPGVSTPSPGGTADLDLVALATVADVVPLIGENRSLVRRGLAEVRRAKRVGMRALLDAAKCDPARLDEGDLAFRLAPRINAAGRLYRADAGVELFLTGDEKRAEAIAAELSRANSERRATEREVDAAAEAALRELPQDLREARGLVLAGEDWHPGVVGIVASRLVERHNRPVVVISLGEDGSGRGSGRSIPGFDLLAALEACAEHLVGFGGHRGAAGLRIRGEDVAAFREAFAAHANRALSEEDLRRSERIDAIVGGTGLGLELAEELQQLAPFGMGNPGVRLLVPSARVSDVRTMGEGKHARFSLHSGSHRALGVAFGRSSLGVEAEDVLDASVRLEVNHWNGSIEPRLVLRELYPLEDPEAEEPVPAHSCACDEPEWWRRFEAELSSDPIAETAKKPLEGAFLRSREAGRRLVAGSAPVTVVLAELVSSGAGVLAVCADASRRAALASGATGLARFNGGSALVACHRCAAEGVARLRTRSGGGLALTDYAALEREPELAAGFEHVVLVDPPRSPVDEARVGEPYGPAGEPGAQAGPGFLHAPWTEAEREFAARALAEEWATREGVAAAYRALRETGDARGSRLRQALAGAGSHPLGAEAAARRFRVLAELGLVQGSTEGGAGTVRVVSSVRTDLQRSAAFRAYSERLSEGRQYLARPKPR